MGNGIPKPLAEVTDLSNSPSNPCPTPPIRQQGSPTEPNAESWRRHTEGATLGLWQDSEASASRCTKGLRAATQSRPGLSAITIRLTADEKRRFALLAANRGQSESQLGLEAIRLLLGSAVTPSLHIESANEPSSDRITIRLRPGDRRALSERASRRGTKASTYIAAMVRAHLRTNPPLTADELSALKQAVIVLAGVGRALVLIARSGNQRGGLQEEVRQDLSHLRCAVAVLEQRMREFARAALVSWECQNG